MLNKRKLNILIFLQGLTVHVDDNDNLVIARILAGGMIDRQGLLHAGDVIREVNGVDVRSPEELQTEIARAKESVTLKVVPSMDPDAAAIAGQVKKAPSASLTLHDGTTTLVSLCSRLCGGFRLFLH